MKFGGLTVKSVKCGGKTPELSGQWDTDQECTAFTGRTIGLDAPFVGVNHGLDITQPQAKTFTLWIFLYGRDRTFQKYGKGFPYSSQSHYLLS